MFAIPPSGARGPRKINGAGLPARNGRAKLAAMERRLEGFHEELWRAQYNNWSGLRSNLDISSIYSRYRACFSPKAIQDLRTTKAAPKRILYAASFMISNYLEAAYKESTEALSLAETQATIDYNGKSIPYRAATSSIVNEPDAASRHLLAESYANKTAELNPLRTQLYYGLDEHAQIVGFNNYTGMCDQLFDLQLPNIRPIVMSILKDTASVYRQLLNQYFSRLDIPASKGQACDLSVILRARDYDHYFEEKQLLGAMWGTLRGMGINIESQDSIKLDLESRPLKHPRSFCAPIRIPQEIYLVLSPRGGWLDYRTGFHELGHALHFANTDRRLPFSYRFCGDLSVTEGFAFLFDNIVSNRRWVEEYTNMSDQSGYLTFSRFFRLYLVRHLAAKILYELELYAPKDPALVPQRYSDIFTACFRVQCDSNNYLMNLDRGFYSLLYLRGMALEAQLRHYLNINYGRQWFANSKAGDFLKDLWGYGLKYDANQIARLLGFSGIDYNFLSQDIMGAFKSHDV